ncbi:phosphoglucomutase (alpha-D-glucose-1,6-bisphosphate-dependent) [Shewanella cyperi]|uniref:phosphoglucomutase (alpha-D-glucose-1,6-bisphosphate-dependent) n=1 Tax=Shewanella cyperi TaxID=2814292 RepID=UPI001A94214B|nr:phosphoglucomutase (alpha-D-glucose-1,6-bisphosphate-dependent) [Shewanella cyperi]QSX39232.1 alpha-D-glucose phosphate-specific phosphoglucomutase [Shewanella cyperi]
MAIHERAGTLAQQQDLVNIPKLMSHYFRLVPDAGNPAERVSFGTSGHRGCAFLNSFNERHILAITQAVVDYRKQAGIQGPLYLGMDTHALSQAAYVSAIEVLVANQVCVIAQENDSFTPTPVVSHAILCANRNANSNELSDGLIITPSHNPPQDGGIKYNPPHGGPAEGEITSWIETRANHYLAHNLDGVRRVNYSVARAMPLLKHKDLIGPYVDDLAQVIDMEAIARAKVRIGVDPLGGSGIYYWDRIAKRYGLDITVVNNRVDPTFGFMTLDKDGKIRMDCSSPHAMAGLLAHKDKFDICVGNDPDYDRHGIVCPGSGLMDPNHFLAVAIDYLLGHRPGWAENLAIGKTLVSSALIDKVCAAHGRPLMEVPVGFKWFVDGLANGTVAFGGEESAGAAFLRRDGGTWCTDKDGFILALLAAEILAVTGQTPAERYEALAAKHGRSFYRRIDSPLNAKMKAKFAGLNGDSLNASTLGGDAILEVLTHAPGNGAAIGGIKIVTANGWIAARPSGTEPLFKLYAESFVSEVHLAELIAEAQALIGAALKG